MFSTKALSSLKGMLPPIHQPLPLNQREAQQLLNALTSSFRKNLDREHGWLPDNGLSGAVSSVLSNAPTASSNDAHRRPTDRHVRAILSNPLFSYDRTTQQAPGRISNERDPMDVFDEAVAKGLMTPRRAAGCLQAKKREIIQSSTLSITEAMAASGAALRVVQWLRASGLERDLSFVENAGLTSTLLKFMVAEGLDEVAWGWLDRLMQGGGPQVHLKQHGSHTAASFVLDSLVGAKIMDAGNLNDAYASILRGEDMFKSTPAFGANFLQAWRHLSWLSTVQAWKRSSPSAPLFDAFVAIGQHLQRPLQIDRAHLDLHHPTNPSHTQAVKFLQNENLWKKISSKAEASQSSSTLDPPRSRPSTFALRLTSMGLDTVQHLTQKGQAEEAQWILDVLRTNLGGYFGRDSPEFNSVFAVG